MTTDAYDRIADAYDGFVAESGLHRTSLPALLEACGRGEVVVDLACGQGALARALAAEGRTVTGVDISRELLEIARRHEAEAPLGIRYQRDDARTLDTLESGTFDGVASHIALGDIDDLGAVLHAVARVLRPGGWFAFAMLHPCFCPPRRATLDIDGRAVLQIGRYFEEGTYRRTAENRVLGGLAWHHRTLSTIWRELRSAGLTVTDLREPYPPDDVLAELPIYGEISTALIVAASKPG